MTIYIAKKDGEIFNIQQDMIKQYINLGYDVEKQESNSATKQHKEENKNGN